MELFDLLGHLEQRTTELMEENELLSREAREAEQLRVENHALREALEEERALRGQIESRIANIVSILDTKLDNEVTGQTQN